MELRTWKELEPGETIPKPPDGGECLIFIEPDAEGVDPGVQLAIRFSDGSVAIPNVPGWIYEPPLYWDEASRITHYMLIDAP